MPHFKSKNNIKPNQTKPKMSLSHSEYLSPRITIQVLGCDSEVNLATLASANSVLKLDFLLQVEKDRGPKISVYIKTRGEHWVSLSLLTEAQANPDPGHTHSMGLKGFTWSAVYIEFLCFLVWRSLKTWQLQSSPEEQECWNRCYLGIST